MHRATGSNTSHRAYSAGGARALIDEIDDKKLMQQMSGGMLKSEARKMVESLQQYGFTSVVHKADKDKDGNITDCAESIMSFVGGSRSLPICNAMIDRRHRLKGLDEGDVAIYRGKDDAQQFLLSAKGFFTSLRSDKTMRMALVPDKRQQQQSAGSDGARSFAAGGDGIESFAADSGGGIASFAADSGGQSSNSQQGQQQQKQKGQDSLFDDNEKSETYYELNKQHHKAGSKEGNYTMEIGRNTQFQAKQHIRKGETHRDSQMFVNGNVHAADHLAGGGTSISSSENWTATGRSGTVSLLQTAGSVLSLTSRMTIVESKTAGLEGRATNVDNITVFGNGLDVPLHTRIDGGEF